MRILIFLLFSSAAFSQEQIFEYVNGVRSIVPIEIIEDNKVYNVVNGVKQITPSYEIKSNGTQLPQKLENEPLYVAPVIGTAVSGINYYKIYSLIYVR